MNLEKVSASSKKKLLDLVDWFYKVDPASSPNVATLISQTHKAILFVVISSLGAFLSIVLPLISFGKSLRFDKTDSVCIMLGILVLFNLFLLKMCAFTKYATTIHT